MVGLLCFHPGPPSLLQDRLRHSEQPSNCFSAMVTVHLYAEEYWDCQAIITWTYSGKGATMASSQDPLVQIGLISVSQDTPCVLSLFLSRRVLYVVMMSSFVMQYSIGNITGSSLAPGSAFYSFHSGLFVLCSMPISDDKCCTHQSQICSFHVRPTTNDVWISPG